MSHSDFIKRENCDTPVFPFFSTEKHPWRCLLWLINFAFSNHDLLMFMFYKFWSLLTLTFHVYHVFRSTMSSGFWLRICLKNLELHLSFIWDFSNLNSCMLLSLACTSRIGVKCLTTRSLDYWLACFACNWIISWILSHDLLMFYGLQTSSPLILMFKNSNILCLWRLYIFNLCNTLNFWLFYVLGLQSYICPFIWDYQAMTPLQH